MRNVATVASGTMAVQGITVAFSPLITRMYGPEAFGMLGVFLAIIAVISPVATLTFSTAIVLPSKEKEALGVVKLSLLSSLVVSSIVAFGIIVLYFFPNDIIPIDPIRPYLFIVPIVIFFTAIIQISHQWFIRTGKYRNIANLSTIQALIVNFSKIGFGFVNAVGAVLIVLSGIGYLIHALLFYYKTNNEFKKALKISAILGTKKKYFKALVYKYRDFPKFRAPQMLFNAFTKGMPILLLASFFGPAAAGFYSIGNRVLNLPTDIIGKSIGSVYYPRISKAAQNGENLNPYILKATLGMAGLAIVPFIVLIIISPILFEYVFGAEWKAAGYYARWIAILVFFEFILHPTKDAMIVCGFQQKLLWFEIISVFFKLFMLSIGFYYFRNEVAAISLFSIGGAVLSLGLLAWLLSNAYSFSTKN